MVGPTILSLLTISSSPSFLFSYLCYYIIHSTTNLKHSEQFNSDTTTERKIREWNMVGLGVVLEEQQPHKKKCNININNNNNTYQVINKTTMMLSSTINNNASSPLSYHSPFKVSTFLDQCFLCSKKLLPGKDIYMYKWVLGTKISVACIFILSHFHF